MPRHPHVHWPDDLSSRYSLTRESLAQVPIGGALGYLTFCCRPSPDPLTAENLALVPLGGALANPNFREPDPITRENLDQVPGIGFYAGTWEWHADPARPPRRRDRGGYESWRRRV